MIDELKNLKLANSHLLEENKKLKEFPHMSEKINKFTIEIGEKRSGSSRGSQNPE